VAGGLDRDLDLGAHAIGGGDQDGIGETGGLEIEQAAEAADLGVCARASRPAHERLDQFHHAVAGIDIDTGGRVACLIHLSHQIGQVILPGRGGITAPPTSESPGAQARGADILCSTTARRERARATSRGTA